VRLRLIGIEIVGTERRGFSFAPIFENADIGTLAEAQEFAKRVSKALNRRPDIDADVVVYIDDGQEQSS
jgi:hypothetical protein